MKPPVDSASMPLMRVVVNVGPRPRTVTCRPSPPARVIATPGMRCNASARFRSGKSAMSSATITSTAPFDSRFALNEALRLLR